MYDEQYQKLALRWMKEEQPSLSEGEIINTLKLIEKAVMLKRHDFDQQGDKANIDDWVPSPDTVKQITSFVISPLDFNNALSTFIALAKEKKFPIAPTLDAKFKAHVNWMITNNKIRPRERLN